MYITIHQAQCNGGYYPQEKTFRVVYVSAKVSASHQCRSSRGNLNEEHSIVVRGE